MKAESPLVVAAAAALIGDDYRAELDKLAMKAEHDAFGCAVKTAADVLASVLPHALAGDGPADRGAAYLAEHGYGFSP